MNDTASRQLDLDLEPQAQPAPTEETFTDKLIKQLKTVFDPEIPVDIYELGLIYKIDVNEKNNVDIDMTLTAPACPVAGEMPGWVKEAVLRVEGIGEVTVNMVFDPPWTPERMSEEARLELNMF
jgi:FeS assembly SUF system protein